MRSLAPARRYAGPRLARFRLFGSVVASAVALPCLAVGCYSTGDGTPPPKSTFYFPVGLAVSAGGKVLYAVNADFDLQWNGGTLQSYDLNQIRQDTLIAIANPNDPHLHPVRPA